ncbi:CinA family protein [Kineococcus sp. SYSU DK006]|uniref:CinA family protein n=1 Tax=Kineococcus sp. SYSU DK006 TaxID=3383127 RepID=UPI003D7EC75E
MSPAGAPELVAALRAAALTVATAESLTGGLVCARLVDVPGASAVVRGGVVAYATELKASVLGVDAGRLARTGPVDGLVAEQMARGVRERLGADVGVSTTGVAGPGPADGCPPGTVFVGVAADRLDGGARHVRLALAGERAQVRAAAVDAAIAELAALVTQLAPEHVAEHGGPAGS